LDHRDEPRGVEQAAAAPEVGQADVPEVVEGAVPDPLVTSHLGREEEAPGGDPGPDDGGGESAGAGGRDALYGPAPLGHRHRGPHAEGSLRDRSSEDQGHGVVAVVKVHRKTLPTTTPADDSACLE